MRNARYVRYVIAGAFLILYLSLFVLLFLNIQNLDLLLASVTDLYARYGILLIFIVSVLEGIFLVGSYVPGTAVILFCAALAKTGSGFLPLVILAGAGGLVCGYCLSYILGRYGWYAVLGSFGLLNRLEKTKKIIERNEGKSLFFGFLSTFVAALLATSAGIMRLPFRRFFLIALVSQFFWTTLWSVIAYVFGELLVENVIRSAVIIAIVGVCVWWVRRRLMRN